MTEAEKTAIKLRRILWLVLKAKHGGELTIQRDDMMDFPGDHAIDLSAISFNDESLTLNAKTKRPGLHAV